MAFEGDLKHINLADVFQNIQANSLTGTLKVDDSGRGAYALFDKGRISGFVAGAEADRPSLAELLLKKRLVSEAALGRALRRVGRKTLSKFLEDEGVLDRDTQTEAVQGYVRDEVCDLFTWKEARFRFDEGAPDKGLVEPSIDRLKVAIEPASLLLEAARRSDEWERIRRKIPSFREVLSPTGKAIADEEMSDVERDVLATLDGRRDLDQVIAHLPYGRFTVAEAVTALLESGVIKPLEAADLREQADVLRRESRIEEAAKLLERSLELERGSPEGRGALAEIYEALGRRDEAVDQLKQLGYLLCEAGRREHAILAYRRAVQLAPKDLGLHETLLRLIEEKGAEPGERAQSARAFAEAALDQHLYDKAIGTLKPLLTLPVARSETRDLLARAYVKKADVGAAVAIWVDEAKERIQAADDAGARAALDGILKLDPKHTWASARLREVKQLSLRTRRKARRRFTRKGLVALAVLVLGGQVVREKLAHDHLRAGYAKAARRANDGTPVGLREAAEGLAAVAARQPYTVSAYYAGALLAAIAEHEVLEAEVVLGQAAPGTSVGAQPAPPSDPLVRRAFDKVIDGRRERLAALLPHLDGQPAARDRVLGALAALEAGRR